MATFLPVTVVLCMWKCPLMVLLCKSLWVSQCWCSHSVHTNIAQVFIAFVGVMTEVDDIEVRTEKLTFKRLREGLV